MNKFSPFNLPYLYIFLALSLGFTIGVFLNPAQAISAGLKEIYDIVRDWQTLIAAIIAALLVTRQMSEERRQRESEKRRLRRELISHTRGEFMPWYVYINNHPEEMIDNTCSTDTPPQPDISVELSSRIKELLGEKAYRHYGIFLAICNSTYPKDIMLEQIRPFYQALFTVYGSEDYSVFDDLPEKGGIRLVF